MPPRVFCLFQKHWLTFCCTCHAAVRWPGAEAPATACATASRPLQFASSEFHLQARQRSRRVALLWWAGVQVSRRSVRRLETAALPCRVRGTAPQCGDYIQSRDESTAFRSQRHTVIPQSRWGRVARLRRRRRSFLNVRLAKDSCVGQVARPDGQTRFSDRNASQWPFIRACISRICDGHYPRILQACSRRRWRRPTPPVFGGGVFRSCGISPCEVMIPR
jgi:hypothetical protein